jgi:hypothetical protein
MMWAKKYHRLEPLTLLSSQWQRPSLERCGQIFFGGVFDKRVRMLFAARRNEDGNVHRRDGVSKTVTKNMWDGFFKNQKIKERPNMSADNAGNAITAEIAEMSFRPLILAGMSCFLSALFSRFARLTLKSGYQTARTIRFDGSLLATSDRLVDVDVFLIKNFNLLIISNFCQFFVEKTFELRIEVCDMIRRVGFFPPRLFLFYPHQLPHRPSTTPAPGGIRTQKKTAARHPLGLLRVGRFGSIFFTPLPSRFGGVGLSKCKGKLNTIKKINTIVNLPVLLLGRAWAKAAKGVKKILADFLFVQMGSALQKLVHPEGCVLLQWLDEGKDKKCDKIFSLLLLLNTEEEVLFFGVCF